MLFLVVLIVALPLFFLSMALLAKWIESALFSIHPRAHGAASFILKPATFAKRKKPHMKGRALTPELKAQVLQRIQAAWNEVPHLRLSQFLHSATVLQNPGRDIFYVEDEELCEELEAYVFGKKPNP